MAKVSFLDEPDNRRRTPDAPARSSAERAGRGSREPRDRSGRPPPGGPRRDRRGGGPRALLIRRGLAVAAGLLVLVLAVLLVRGCLDRQQQRAFEEYLQEVSALAAESRQESEALFQLLEDPGDLSAVDVQNTLNGLSVDSQRLAERAADVEPPTELADVHEQIVLALELRQDGLEGVASQIPSALGDEQREEAVAAIADEMRAFLASDVVLAERALPRIEQRLEDEELQDAVTIEVPSDPFLPGVEWLQDETVKEAASGIRSADGGAEDEEAATPGLHGTGLVGVTLQPAGVALAPDAPNEVAGGDGSALDVEVQNQGESEEEDVTVLVTLSGSGEPIETEASVAAIPEGAGETVSVPLEAAPPAGEELELTVEVEPVPGEEETENNQATYSVTFLAQ